MTIGKNEAFRRNVGCKLRQMRKAKKMTQKQIADVIGCSFQNVSSIEHGRYTGTRNLFVLANLFGVTVDELLRGDSEHASM